MDGMRWDMTSFGDFGEYMPWDGLRLVSSNEWCGVPQVFALWCHLTFDQSMGLEEFFQDDLLFLPSLN
jgi:hypothetical protein